MAGTNQLATIGNWSIEDIETMKQTLAAGTTDSQFQLFLRTAHASGLNPFLNHIYAIVYQGKMSLQIGIEGIAYLAKQHEGYRGYDAQIVCENDTFKAKKSTVYNEKTGEREDEWIIVDHEIGFPRGKIVGAYAIAYRDGFPPFTVLMDWSEVEHFLNSQIPNQKTMWTKYTADMFKKHVAKRALKGQFGIDISEDDIPGAGSILPESEPQRRDITAEVNAAAQKEEPKHETPADDADELKKCREKMKENFSKLGITTPEGIEEYIANHGKIKGEKPTLAEYKALLKVMDLHIAEKQAADDSLPM
ncbi:recombinase RecT [Paenibacillus faecis]|uniref:Recombinase RecT n=1 Tax=Paenibacillus faecis TaxID=862114 RepID=A0A5D0CM81_9BACL|nr:RecT family recombinase [Paenibacillus faecis]TYA10958.1 recombinase RecT [Paenibacillus faecis]